MLRATSKPGHVARKAEDDGDELMGFVLRLWAMSILEYRSAYPAEVPDRVLLS